MCVVSRQSTALVLDFFLQFPFRIVCDMWLVLLTLLQTAVASPLTDNYVSHRLGGQFLTTSFPDVHFSNFRNLWLKCPNSVTPTVKKALFGFKQLQRTSQCRKSEDGVLDLTATLSKTCQNGSCEVRSQYEEGQVPSEKLYWQICLKCQSDYNVPINAHNSEIQKYELGTTSTFTTTAGGNETGSEGSNRKFDKAKNTIKSKIADLIKSKAESATNDIFKTIEALVALGFKYMSEDSNQTVRISGFMDIEMLTARDTSSLRFNNDVELDLGKKHLKIRASNILITDLKPYSALRDATQQLA